MNLDFKDNVTVIFTRTNKAIAYAFCQACLEVLGPDYTPMITSGQEGTHSPESGHYHGRALDFRSRDIKSAKKRKEIERIAQEILGPNYWVKEYASPPHFHIQRNKDSF